MGLLPPVSQQILLRGQPTAFEQAVETAKEVEYALNFETKSTDEATKDINVINRPRPMEDPKLAIQLQLALDQMTKLLEDLEQRLIIDNSTDSGERSSRLLGVRRGGTLST